ncbi:hypothetical protein ADT25_11280 [Xanthomonas oryzae]|uniref:Uncharacterized protein n=1 Tax=Xanthomonas oryzae TaxID=347 RepID=A0AAP0ZL47_9XANT|nr:hypothetical protein [Xanthomonas oryzae]KOR44326.1 hypothetical protein ADT25_11280 [Xanthomonas oryzae]QBG85796.1 hypothetical protein EYR27_20980 [Xanthomonas oryzae]
MSFIGKDSPWRLVSGNMHALTQRRISASTAAVKTCFQAQSLRATSIPPLRALLSVIAANVLAR